MLCTINAENSFVLLTWVSQGLINYIDTKAKCRQLKKLTCKGTLRQVFICLRPASLLRPHGPYRPPPYTLYTSILYILIHTWRGGERVKPERRLEGQQFTKLGRKSTWLTVSPVYTFFGPPLFSLNSTFILSSVIERLFTSYGMWGGGRGNPSK
jgi:hypothetical protein